MSFLISTAQSPASLTSWHQALKLRMAYSGEMGVIQLQEQNWPSFRELQVGESRKEKERLQGKGKWTREEQRAYIQFIRENMSEMETKLMRKSRKVFLNMSKLVRTRTADQCRSHHQKILLYHKSLEEIVRFYEQESTVMEEHDFKKQIKTNADESKESRHQQRVPFRVERSQNRIRIIIEDCLIPAFNFCE